MEPRKCLKNNGILYILCDTGSLVEVALSIEMLFLHKVKIFEFPPIPSVCRPRRCSKQLCQTYLAGQALEKSWTFVDENSVFYSLILKQLLTDD